MTPKPFIPLLFVFLCIAAACRPERSMSRDDALATAVELSTNPMPTPTFVLEMWELDTQNCVEINEFDVWEVGDNGDTSESMMRTAHVEVDGERVYELIHASAGSLIWVRDPITHEVLGTNGGRSSICFESSHLPGGLHLASLRFSSTKGRQFEYVWAFEIGD